MDKETVRLQQRAFLADKYREHINTTGKREEIMKHTQMKQPLVIIPALGNTHLSDIYLTARRNLKEQSHVIVVVSVEDQRKLRIIHTLIIAAEPGERMIGIDSLNNRDYHTMSDFMKHVDPEYIWESVGIDEGWSVPVDENAS